MSAIIDMLRAKRGSGSDLVGLPVAEIPAKIKQRLDRGRSEMKRGAAKRRLCVRFERGDTYWFIDGQGNLNFQSTTTSTRAGVGKPPHRVRNRYNRIRPIITAKVSASTQRTPDFEVVPSSNDQERWSAAHFAENAATYGYDKWRLQDVDQRCTLNAIGHGGEGFAVPYFDPNVGPYHDVPKTDPLSGEPLLDEYGEPQTRAVGEGEVKVVVLGGNEVYWEPGCDFMESRWHATERAVPIEDIEDLPGFFGEKIKPDATTSDIPSERRPENMAMRVDYFERPCPSYPDGRHIVIANKRQVVPEEPYPLRDRHGSVIDEPVPHRLAWDLDGGALRDFGLTWQLIDAQRTFQDCVNKAVEWKNRCLFPQWWAPTNTIVTPRTDEPGVTNYYSGQTPPIQEKVEPIPNSLAEWRNNAIDDMQTIGFSTDVDPAPNVAARTVNVAVQQTDLQWAQFLQAKADWWSRLMRHCLLLVSRHYSEPRLLKLRGRDGWENIQDFLGAQMMDEVDVRVNAASLAVLTRSQVQQMVAWIATTFPGWLSPQDALAAIQTASLERLMASYWLDMQRANTIIQKIRDGSVMSMPTRGNTDPLTGQMGDPVPGYMPTDQDNLDIWSKVFGDWMKTDDFAQQPPPMQEVAQQVWDGIQALEAQQAQRQAMLQSQMAEQQGMSNATKPSQPTALPSQPSPVPEGT